MSLEASETNLEDPMGYFNYYRFRHFVDWPCEGDYLEGRVDLPWRVRLGMAVASLTISALLVGIVLLVGR